MLFHTDGDREHFIELLEGLVERYHVILHAYVLMDKHYQLLIESPEGNVSKALQWLNTSYSSWYNRSHNGEGALFQSRFKSVPIDKEGAWALECSLSIHLNPVRVRKLGPSKGGQNREKLGKTPIAPSKEKISKRLEALRSHSWSSYPVYAGYKKQPKWLTCKELWKRCRNTDCEPKTDYRKWVENAVKQGVVEGVFAKHSTAVAAGSAAFIAELRKQVLKQKGGDTNERHWRRLLPFTDVMSALGSVRGEPWENFVNRHGDWGRDLALYIGRLHCGLKLEELGGYCDMKGAAVSRAALRISERLPKDQALAKAYRKTLRILGEKKA